MSSLDCEQSFSKMQEQPIEETNAPSQSAGYDHIIIGAGVAGTVVASRLHECDPSLSILLMEGGPDVAKTSVAAAVADPLRAFQLRGTEVDWAYSDIPQKHLNNQVLPVPAGRAVGGSSVINLGMSCLSTSISKAKCKIIGAIPSV